ncbi:MAG: hypothetical protein BMS9Abin29_0184 [Gemmatimonadota bacterium]|nr:MAG: hypothetical protein BMS9Abin29_0184 [Gemmatimonadota bacterium]
MVVGIFFWLFLHAVAAAMAGAVGASPNSWVNALWVVAMTLGLLSVELRRKRLRDFLAALGLSGGALWGAALIAVGILETSLWVALAIAGEG